MPLTRSYGLSQLTLRPHGIEKGLMATEDFHSLLRYLAIDEVAFAEWEQAYFHTLGELLAQHRACRPNQRIDRSTFGHAVRKFQRRSRLDEDGIPGEETLWLLQQPLADERLPIVQTGADVWVRPPRTPEQHDPNRDGYSSFMLRTDAAIRYAALLEQAHAAGALVTSSGSLRLLDMTVHTGRSMTSLHYAGLALDLATVTGMIDPAIDPYLITADGECWRVWARADDGSERSLAAVVWSAGAVTMRNVVAKVIDFTALAQRHGFQPIGPRPGFPLRYMAAEWWHFQYEEALVPWISQFGIELLRTDRYSTEQLQAAEHIWNGRKAIFRRGYNGWG